MAGGSESIIETTTIDQIYNMLRNRHSIYNVLSMNGYTSCV